MFLFQVVRDTTAAQQGPVAGSREWYGKIAGNVGDVRQYMSDLQDMFKDRAVSPNNPLYIQNLRDLKGAFESLCLDLRQPSELSGSISSKRVIGSYSAFEESFQSVVPAEPKGAQGKAAAPQKIDMTYYLRYMDELAKTVGSLAGNEFIGQKAAARSQKGKVPETAHARDKPQEATEKQSHAAGGQEIKGWIKSLKGPAAQARLFQRIQSIASAHHVTEADVYQAMAEGSPNRGLGWSMQYSDRKREDYLEAVIKRGEKRLR